MGFERFGWDFRKFGLDLGDLAGSWEVWLRFGGFGWDLWGLAGMWELCAGFDIFVVGFVRFGKFGSDF